MAVTTHDLTVKAPDLLGAAYDPTLAPVVFFLDTNLGPGEALIDTVNGAIRLGPARLKADSAGTAVFTNLIGTDSDNADLNLAVDAVLQYRIRAEYTDAVTRRTAPLWSSGWFELNDDANLATDITFSQYAPISWQTAFMEQAQELLDAQILISGIDDTDSAVAALIEDELVGPLTNAALDASYEPTVSRRDSTIPPGTKALTIVGSPAPMIKGLNVPITAWNDDWDETWVHAQINHTAQLGMNAIRIIGDDSAYTANPTLFKTNLYEAFEYARSKGVKVIYAFMSGSWVAEPLNLDDANIPDYEDMVADLMDGYVGDPLIFAWDAGNELDGRTSWVLDIITAVTAQIRTTDPDAMATSSVVYYLDTVTPGNTEAVTTAITAIDSLVDFHDVHVYQPVGRDPLPTNLPRMLAAATDKPILFGEIGGNQSASGTGNAPWVGGQRGQEFHAAAFRRYAAAPNVIGFMWWKSGDAVGNTTKMGLYDEDGDPTRQLGVIAGFPAARLDAALDLVEQRTHPIMVHSFYRTANATSFGTPDLGATASGSSNGAGSVFGSDANGGYIATKSGGEDYILYDLVCQRSRFDSEWRVTDPTALDVGIVYRANAALTARRLFRFYYDSGVSAYRASIPTVDSPSVATVNGSPAIAPTDLTNVHTKFRASQVGAPITGTGIPGSTTISSVADTTVAAGSNGASLPQATISLASVAGLRTGGGTVAITSSAGTQVVAYTGVAGSTITGCTGGTGTLATGNSVNGAVLSANATASATVTATVSMVYATSAAISGLHTAGTPNIVSLSVDLTGNIPVFSVNGNWHWTPIPITDPGLLMVNNGRMGPRWGNPDTGTRLRYMQGSVPGRRFV